AVQLRYGEVAADVELLIRGEETIEGREGELHVVRIFLADDDAGEPSIPGRQRFRGRFLCPDGGTEDGGSERQHPHCRAAKEGTAIEDRAGRVCLSNIHQVLLAWL